MQIILQNRDPAVATPILDHPLIRARPAVMHTLLTLTLKDAVLSKDSNNNSSQTLGNGEVLAALLAKYVPSEDDSISFSAGDLLRQPQFLEAILLAALKQWMKTPASQPELAEQHAEFCERFLKLFALPASPPLASADQPSDLAPSLNRRARLYQAGLAFLEHLLGITPLPRGKGFLIRATLAVQSSSRRAQLRRLRRY